MNTDRAVSIALIAIGVLVAGFMAWCFLWP